MFFVPTYICCFFLFSHYFI